MGLQRMFRSKSTASPRFCEILPRLKGLRVYIRFSGLGFGGLGVYRVYKSLSGWVYRMGLTGAIIKDLGCSPCHGKPTSACPAQPMKDLAWLG